MKALMSAPWIVPAEMFVPAEYSLTLMQVVEIVLKFLYFAGLFGLAVYGLNNFITTLLYWRTRKRQMKARMMTEWPAVTVQLPIYNERYTIERLLTAVAALDYPRDKLQIQILDDSTDDTAQLTRRLAEQFRAGGVRVEVLQRTDRWGHVNHKYSLFTTAQALGMDGHFVVEQAARASNGLFLNFNGTAGLWRRAAIEDAGGWQPDTLTEDLDLSYRAQLRGWHIEYLPEVVVPAEIPVQVEAFKKQQFRWAKGSFQVVRKLFAGLMQAHVPLGKRVMGLVHITGYFVHPLMIGILLLILPVGLMAPEYLKMLSWMAFTALGPPLLYLVSRTSNLPRWQDRLKVLPMLVLIGFGLSLNNTIAVLEGLFSSKMGTFIRTPKFNIKNRRDGWARSRYTVKISPMVWGEIALGLYALAAAVILGEFINWMVAPWLLVYMGGYFYIAGMNLYQTWQTQNEFNASVVRA